MSNRLNASDLKQVNTLTADKKNIAKTEVYEGSTFKNTTSYTYNADGTVASQTVTNDGGNAVTNFAYQYNADGSYTVTATAQGVKNADGTVSSISTSTHIDPLGRKVSETDGNGNTTQYEYDMLGQVTKQVNPDGTSQQIVYDVPNNRLSVTDENGNTVTQSYTPVGNLEKIYLDQDPTQLVGEYAYDKLGRKIRETSYMDIGGLAVSNEYTYDDFNRPVTVTSKSGDEILDVATTVYEIGPGVMEVGWVDSNHPLQMDVSDYKKVEINARGTCTLSAYQDGVLTQSDKKEYNQVIHLVLDLSETEELKIRTTSSGQNITCLLYTSDAADE